MATLPSVTRILKAQGFYPPRLAEQFYLDRGRAAHKACELDDAGSLDMTSVDMRVAPFLAAHRKARKELALKPMTPPMAETYIKAWPLGYAGQVDSVGILRGRITVMDFKCGDGGDDPCTRIQVAAYRPLVAAHLGLPLARLDGGSLHYHSDGTYRWIPYTQNELDDGWHTFAAALRTYQWRLQHNRLIVEKDERR